jgi:hypothetical protein
MKAFILLIVGFTLLSCIDSFSNTFPLEGKYQFEGTIAGKYLIQMGLNDVNKETGAIDGRYKYTSSTGSLRIEGEILAEGVFEFLEYDENNQVTGYFVGEIKEKTLEGKWHSPDGSKIFDFSLNYLGDLNNLESLIPVDYFHNAKVRCLKNKTAIDGIYYWDTKYVTESIPDGIPDILHNYGVLFISNSTSSGFDFGLMAICGPTYHIAYAEGSAVLKDDKYVCTLQEDYTENCVLDFIISESTITIDQKSPSFECGFGARAYAGGDYLKVLPEEYVEKFNFEDFDYSVFEDFVIEYGK